MRRMVLAGLVLAGVGLGLASPASAKDCDRSCVAATTDAVLAAFQSGAPTKVLKGVRITENGRDIRLADSQLHAIRKVTYTHAFFEPAAGAVGVHGAAEAAGGPEIFALRLRLKGDRVIEAESIVTRRGEASLFSPQTMTGQAAWDQVLPPERRTPREAMIAAATAYFDGVEAETGSNVPAAPGCDRCENGVKTTNLPGEAQEGCTAFSQLAYIERVRDRRMPLVDEERGLIWALAVLDIPGGTYPAPVGSRSATVKREPRSILIAELFKVEAGQIHAIETVMRDLPLGAGAGWALPKPPKTKKK